jgi:hypothetical protein
MLTSIRSVILFAVCILAFVWRTSTSTSPTTFTALSPQGALGVRIAITIVFLIGLVCFVLIVNTLRKYGARMDEKWKQKVMKWVAENVASTVQVHPTGTLVPKSQLSPSAPDRPPCVCDDVPAPQVPVASKEPVGGGSGSI